MLLAENQRLSVMLSRAIRISSVILLFVLASASLCADNLLRNPGFRSFGDDGLPAEWKLSMASGMDAVLKILPAAGPEKQNVLSLVNRSGRRHLIHEIELICTHSQNNPEFGFRFAAILIN